MKNIFKYIAIGLLTVSTASCNDFLDVKPVGRLIPTKVTQFENILNNSSTLTYFLLDNNQNCGYALRGDNMEMSDAHIKYTYLPSFPNNDMLASYIFYKQQISPTSTPMSWQYGLFRPLGMFNNVIDGVESLDKDSEYAKGVIAQAKVGRAWLYLNGAVTYGPMWDPNGKNDTPVLPIRTSGDPTVSNGPLATTAQIFDLVKTDLDYACENTPIFATNPCRANRAAAYALRAEYHMYKREWKEMAADAAKAWEYALQAGGSEANLFYDFNDFYYTKETTSNPPAGVDPRTAMTFKGPDNNFALTVNRENMLYRKGPGQPSAGRWYPSEEWMALFDKDNDMRWGQFALMNLGTKGKVNGETFDDGLHIAYYRHSLTCNNQGLSYPMLLLVKAEGEARSGNAAAALASLNILRKYRYKTGTPALGGLSGDALLEEILKERRREQPIATYHRVADIKRYYYDEGKPWRKDKIEHKTATTTYSQDLTGPYFNSITIDNVIRKLNPQWNLPQDEATFEPYTAW